MWSSEDAIGREPIPADMAGEVDATFVIRGNSVSDYGIWDGDRVYAKQMNGAQPVHGDVVVVESEGSYFCKIFRENKLGRYLESHEAGKEPEPFLMTGEVKLVGLVVGWPQKFRRRT
jgi:SOS-response transcriptional repressor LexA